MNQPLIKPIINHVLKGSIVIRLYTVAVGFDMPLPLPCINKSSKQVKKK